MQRSNPLMTDQYYHVYNRGIDKRDIFKSQHDFQRFLMLLHTANSEKSVKLNNLIGLQGFEYQDVMNIPIDDRVVSVGPWCLMTNHFHIILHQRVDGGITNFMHKLGTGYSNYFNKKYQRQGSLFGSRFKSKLIDSDEYMRYLFQYIHLNPLDIEFPDWEGEFLKYRELSEDQIALLQEYEYCSYKDFVAADGLKQPIIDKPQFEHWFQYL